MRDCWSWERNPLSPEGLQPRLPESYGRLVEQPEDVDPLAGVAEHYLVAQATGVLMAQYEVSVDTAFEKLTAEAAQQGRNIIDVADEIVQNRGLSTRDSERP